MDKLKETTITVIEMFTINQLNVVKQVNEIASLAVKDIDTARTDEVSLVGYFNIVQKVSWRCKRTLNWQKHDLELKAQNLNCRIRNNMLREEGK